jgi:hypothetical protein
MEQNYIFNAMLTMIILATTALILVLVLISKKRRRGSLTVISQTIDTVPKAEDDDSPTSRNVVPQASAKAAMSPRQKYMDRAYDAENTIDSVLRTLNESRYFVFRDIIIPSSFKDLELTQIDHVLVSRAGIFCIETKSTKGNIYGFTKNEHWDQYLSPKPFKFNSPFRQNKHHVSSLELLLSNEIKAPIHSYLAFPNAHKVVIDKKIEDMTPEGVISKIAHHTKIIYDASEVEKNAKILAHASTLRDQLRERHIKDVKAYIDAKVTPTLKLS